MKQFFCIAALLIATATARAELGETLEQCTARYGEPVNRKTAANVDEMVFFKKEEIRISVGLKDGKCVLLILGNDSGDKLSELQVDTLLKENADGSLWKKNPKSTGNPFWMRADKAAAAKFDSLSGLLTLVSTEYAQAQMAKKSSETSVPDGG